jgi:sec-independent protein translocase protein TatA
MMFEGLFQPSHLLVILVLCVLLFGPKKIPELGKALGDGIRGFKDGISPSQAKPDIKADTKPQEDNTQTK